MRHVHYIKHNKGCDTPQNCVWFDTETDQRPVNETTVEHHLRFGIMGYSRRMDKGQWLPVTYSKFLSIQAFYDQLLSRVRPQTRLYVFCHNTSFDLQVVDLFTQMADRGWKIKRSIVDSPPTIIEYRKDKSTIIFLDTLNFWRMSLANLGDYVGIPKLPMPDIKDSQAKWDEYATRDVTVLVKACLSWFAFLQKEDLGGFAPTLAGQSFRTFRHRFMTTRILIDNHVNALDVSRRAYYGGRTECFHVGSVNEKLYLLDINSMYPFVMQKYEYPVKFVATFRMVSVSAILQIMQEFAVTADVTIETADSIYPYRMKNKLVFPTGVFRTCLSTPELQVACERGHIKKIHYMAVYKKAPIFKEFVDYMYNHRLIRKKRGDEVGSWMFKTLLNSLYGKFGQRGNVFQKIGRTESREIKLWDEWDMDTKTMTSFRQYGGIIEQKMTDQESRESHPAIASHVTAYARMYLWNLINKAGLQNVLYVDTDSLLCTNNGYQNLKDVIDPNTLGMLKLEQTIDSAHIWGCKDYRFDSKEKHKGVKKKAVWVANDRVLQDQWSTIKGNLRLGSLTAPRTKQIEKTLHRIYDKGTVLSSGRVIPLVLP